MITIVRCTTPTITFELDDEELDLTQASNVYVTFRCGDTIITKTGDGLQVSEKSVTVGLTQKETLSMAVGSGDVQLNWTYSDGTRWSSDCEQIKVTKQLLEKVIA